MLTLRLEGRRSDPQAARRIKPHGIHIYEDLAEETMAKRRELLPKLKRAKEEGKIALTDHKGQTN